MRKILLFLTAFVSLAIVLVSCDKAEEKTLTLTPDKTTITADGVETVTFTVRLDGQDVTANSKIINSGTGTEIQGASFTATAAGNYIFHAEYDGKKSESVAITVTEFTPQYGELLLSVDKRSIVGDDQDKALFTVTYDGTDVTSKSSVCMTSGTCLMANEFTSDEPGSYEFYASYTEAPGIKSNYVTVTVTVPEDVNLVLTADKESVPAAAGQKITFTVMHGTTDVTSSARIVNQRTGSDIAGNTFTTTDNRKDSFIAVYEGGSSAQVDVLKEVPSDFYKRIAVQRFTGTWCTYCYPAGESIKKLAAETYPDQLIHIAIHGNGSGSTDPMTCTDGQYITSNAGVKGFPSLIFDYRAFVLPWVSEEWDLKCASEALEFPAKAGLAVESKIEGNSAKVTVTLWSGSTEEHFVNVILLEDGIIADQIKPDGTYITGYVHDNVLRKASTTKDGGESWGEIEENDQVTKEFTFDLTGFDSSKCKLAVYSTIKKPNSGNNKIGSNAVACPINGSADFKF